MSWEIDSERPIYTQLIEQIEQKICSGVYPLGGKLPPVRELAQEAAVNPNTMQRALARLEAAGLLHSRRTSGRFVTEDLQTVKQVKENLVQKHVGDFLEKMSQLGFAHQEILTTISTMMEEEQNG